MVRQRPGLTPAEIERIRERLAGGGRPRVRLSGPQFAPDTQGTVVRVGDPAVDGEDYIVVRAKVAGTVDELAFSPNELAGTATSTASARPASPRRATRPAAASHRIAPVETDTPPPPAATPPPPTATPAKAPRRRPAVPPAVTVTIASVGADWTVSVERGARSLVRKVPVMPGAVTAIAELIGSAGMIEAVAAVNDSARLEAHSRAEQLRAELAAVEAILDSHRTP